jgi:hypothetical protein
MKDDEQENVSTSFVLITRFVSVGFEVLTAVTEKSSVVWDETPPSA